MERSEHSQRSAGARNAHQLFNEWRDRSDKNKGANESHSRPVERRGSEKVNVERGPMSDGHSHSVSLSVSVLSLSVEGRRKEQMVITKESQLCKGTHVLASTDRGSDWGRQKAWGKRQQEGTHELLSKGEGESQDSERKPDRGALTPCRTQRGKELRIAKESQRASK